MEAKPEVKGQWACGPPGIATAPRSVEVPMTDGEAVEEAVAPEEEESDVKAESGHNDDEEDVDYMNHETLTKDAVRANTC